MSDPTIWEAIRTLGPFPSVPPVERPVPPPFPDLPGDPSRPPMDEPPAPIPLPPQEPPPVPERLAGNA